MLSLLHTLFYTHSNVDLETRLALDRGAQQDRVVGGSVRVAEGMAARLATARPAAGPRPPDRPRRRRCPRADPGRCEQEADAVVVTLPPTLAGRLEYDPPLPSWRDQLTQRMPAGSVIKCYAIYGEPFWRTDGLNGQAISDRGPVKVTFDNSPPVGRARRAPGVRRGRDARCAPG